MEAQAAEALALANQIRMGRAQIRRELKAGTIKLRDVFDHPAVRTMQTYDLLIATPRLGRAKVHGVLSRTGISGVRTVGNLTLGERRRLLEITGQGGST